MSKINYNSNANFVVLSYWVGGEFCCFKLLSYPFDFNVALLSVDGATLVGTGTSFKQKLLLKEENCESRKYWIYYFNLISLKDSLLDY